MGTKLSVGNLGHQTESTELQALFAQFGTVQSAEIVTDRETGRVTGVGFVEMSSEDDAQAAIAGMNGKVIDGRTLTVSEVGPN